MSYPFLEEINKRLLVCDGGMGTLLYERGISFEESFDGVCLSSPDIVRNVHRDYIEAGADVIETNTFGANSYRLEPHGLAESVRLINRTGAMLARQAREEMGRDIFVAGSIGPTGKRLFPLGPVYPENVREAFLHQAEGLLEGGVDLFIIETFSDLDEITLAIKAIRELSDLPIVAQMTFSTELTTLFGATPEDCGAYLSGQPVEVIGANCSVGPQMIIDVIERMAPFAKRPLSAQPNASLPKYIEGRYIYHTSPDYFAEAAGQLLDRGVRLIGGCCGTTPVHIRRVAELVIKKKEIVRPENEALPLPERIHIQIEEKRTSAEPSAFAHALEKKFVVSVELDPPRGSNPEKILKAAQLLAGLDVDAVNIADSPMARVRMGALAAAGLIIQHTGLEVILHMTGRDRNLMGLQSDLLGAHALGVRNILAVTGDPPLTGNYPNMTAVYDVDSLGLLKIIGSLNSGEDIGHNSIGSPTALTPGVAVNPMAQDREREIDRFRLKAEMGAVFAMTQPLYEYDDLERFLSVIGGTRVKILAGILPLVNFRHANFLHHEVPGVVIPKRIRDRMQKAGDSGAQAGVEITLELLDKVKNIVSGVYLMPSFGRYNVIADIIRQMRPVSARHP
jgi:methionine synthase I (cobalamin-dependent)/5,10-methylenetetrahydrofolate reductase